MLVFPCWYFSIVTAALSVCVPVSLYVSVRPLKVTASSADAIRELKGWVDDRTIIVGHSLECDLKALAITHCRIIDTAVLFPHNQGLPFKMSLRQLTKKYLHRDIQQSESEEAAEGGHNSIEDSAAALELAMYRTLHRNASLLPPPWCSSSFTGDRYTIFHDLSRQHCPAVNVCMHQSAEYAHLPDWEQYSLGHKPEADVECLYRQFLDDPCTSAETKEKFNVSMTRGAPCGDVCNAFLRYLLESTNVCMKLWRPRSSTPNILCAKTTSAWCGWMSLSQLTRRHPLP